MKTKNNVRTEKNSKNLRKVVPDWSFELGEHALQIETVCPEPSSSLIVVLGERNLFVLNSNGTMRWQKKLGDFKPIYCHSYFTYKGQVVTDSIGGNSSTVNASSSRAQSSSTSGQDQSLLERDLIVLLITELSTLRIYSIGQKSKQLKWACQLPQLYCQVQRANFYFTANCELTGCLTFLSSNGHLALAFLGTNPSVSIVNTQTSLINRRTGRPNKSSKQSAFSSEEKEQLFANTQMDKEEFDKELNELRKIINAYNSDFSSLIKLNSGQDGTNQPEEDDLTVELVNFKYDTIQDNFSGKQIKLDKLQSSSNAIDLEFRLESNKRPTNLIINLNTSNCFNITPNLHNLARLESTKDNGFQFRLFYDSSNRLISFGSNQIYLVINYFNDKNLPRIYTKLIELPISFFCRLRNQTMFSRTGSSTNTSHNSSASQRSLKAAEGDQNFEQSLDQYLMEGTLGKQTYNTISFQFSTRKSPISLTTILHEMINQHSLNSKLRKADEDHLKSNKVTVQFLNSKMKLVHVEFIQPDEASDQSNDKTSNLTFRTMIIGDDLHSNCFVFNLLVTKLRELYQAKSVDKILFSRSSIPVKEYFELINRHLDLRHQLTAKKKQLQEHCERLRIIEKRILIKLKDRNIFNLNNLESLLNVQHQKVF